MNDFFLYLGLGFFIFKWIHFLDWNNMDWGSLLL